MSRNFYKVSLNELKKVININSNDYKLYKLPQRSTENSAGYDFFLLEDIKIKPKEIKKIPTGIKAQMNEDEVLFIIIRSSLGTKHNITIANQIGVIDSDYYNNKDNEGHIFIVIKNESDEEKVFKKGDRIAQGIFTKYLKVDSDETKEKRLGGFGSTEKGE